MLCVIVVVVVLVAFVGDDAAAHNVIAVGLASVLACSVGFAVAAVGVVLASVDDALVVAACCGCSGSKNHSPSCVDAVPAGFEASTLSPTPTRPSGLTRTLLGAKFRIGLSSPDP